jgi:hypothetical protein
VVTKKVKILKSSDHRHSQIFELKATLSIKLLKLDYSLNWLIFALTTSSPTVLLKKQFDNKSELTISEI